MTNVFSAPTRSVKPVNPRMSENNTMISRSRASSMLGSSFIARTKLGDANSPTSKPQGQTTVIERGERCLLVVWLLGCSVSFSVAITRLFLFGRFVLRSSLQREKADCDANMEHLVQRLSERLHVVRRVRISILDAAVGPAVYGLIRPTILLPAAIALNQPLRELEPLVAHELIHIRRGDLWWALVQTLACCLFWVPPVGLASTGHDGT